MPDYPILQFFAYDHLPEHLQAVSRPFADLAKTIADGPKCAETSAALRKLLEAKDCAVRAGVSARVNRPTTENNREELLFDVGGE